jgi:hypothetical protein
VSAPGALDLYGRRIASTWSAPAGDGREWELRLHTLGGRGTSVRRTVSGALSSVRLLEPAFEAGALYYGIGRRGSAGNRFGRYRLRDGVLDEALSRPGIVHLTFTAGRFVYVQGPLSELDTPCEPASPCLLRRADPVAFGPR